MQRLITPVAAMAVMVPTFYTHADLTGFDDSSQWQNAVGKFATIDFTEYPAGTVITDQYAKLGVQLADGNDFIHHSSSYVNDGAGLHGSNLDYKVTVEFDTPQLWFGIDHAGSAIIDVYSQEKMIGSFENIAGGSGFFAGIWSDVLFDKVVVHRGIESAPRIDDMHWGVPAPGVMTALTVAGVVTGSRRRRC